MVTRPGYASISSSSLLLKTSFFFNVRKAVWRIIANFFLVHSNLKTWCTFLTEESSITQSSIFAPSSCICTSVKNTVERIKFESSDCSSR